METKTKAAIMIAISNVFKRSEEGGLEMAEWNTAPIFFHSEIRTRDISCQSQRRALIMSLTLS